jgi:hypothetical protein
MDGSSKSLVQKWKKKEMILNHQHLLEKYYAAEKAVIMETSYYFNDDINDLITEIREYAEKEGLDASSADIDLDE